MQIKRTYANFDYYELLYRDFRNDKILFAIEPSEDTIAYVKNATLELSSVKAKGSEAIKFSDVIYKMMPVVNNDNSIRYEYTQMLVNKDGKADVNEYINRFNNFNVNNLPLVEVAKYLRIKVEKSNILKVLGQYSGSERKITLGSDYESVFVHELAHAIDSYSDDFVTESSFMELVAELSRAILCREYNIQNDTSASLNYLYHFSDTKIEIKKLFEHVASIYECVKLIKKDIKNGIYDLWQRAGI